MPRIVTCSALPIVLFLLLTGCSKPAADWIKMAQTAEELGQTKYAEELYQNAIKAEPKNPDGYWELGYFYVSNGKWRKAVPLYQTGLKLDPTYEWGYLSLGEAYMRTGATDLAEATYSRGITNLPGSAECLFERGRIRYYAKKYPEALLDFDAAFLIEANAAGLCEYRGKTLARLKRLDEAMAALNKSIAIDSSRPNAFWEIARIHSDRKEHTQAVEALNKALATCKSRDWTYYLLAGGYMQLGDVERAQDAIDSSVRLSPRKPYAHSYQGYIYSRRGEFEKAISSHSKAIELNGMDPHAYQKRAFQYCFLGEYDKASKDFETARGMDPDNVGLNRCIVELLMTVGQYQQALKCSTSLLEKNPEDPKCYLAKGKVLMAMGKYDDATREFQKGINLSPEFPDLHMRLASCYKAQKKYDKAIACLDERLKKRSNDKLLWTRSAVWEARKDYAKALKDIGKALKLKPECEYYLGAQGGIKWKQGDRDGAISSLKQGLQLGRDGLSLNLKLGKMYLSLARTSEAQKAFTRMASLKPRKAYEFRASARGIVILGGDLDQAEKAYDRAAKIEPMNPYSYSMRARFLATQRGDFGRAIKDAKKADGLHASRGAATACLGRIYFNLKRYELAAKEFSRVCSEDSDDECSPVYLFFCRQHLGEDGSRELEKRYAELKENSRLRPVYELLLGKCSVESCHNDFMVPRKDMTELEQACELNYFLALYYRLNGNESKALEYFKQCIKTGIAYFYEYEHAMIQLKQAQLSH